MYNTKTVSVSYVKDLAMSYVERLYKVVGNEMTLVL